MTQYFDNKENFKKITCYLSEGELETFIQILRILRPTPEVSSLNLIIIRLSNCCMPLKKQNGLSH